MSVVRTLRSVPHMLGFVKAFLAVVKRPGADNVLAMERHGTALASPDDTARYIAALEADAPTQALLKDRWTPPRLTLEDLLAYPQGTLGRAYGEHLQTWGLEVEFFPDIDTSRPDEFVRARLYQIHDIIHALTDYDATDAGEMGLIGFYQAQYLLHHDQGGLMAASFMGILASAVLLHGSVINDQQLRPFIDNFVEGYQRGRASKCLIGPRWEEQLGRQLEEIRAEFRIPARHAIRREVAHA